MADMDEALTLVLLVLSIIGIAATVTFLMEHVTVVLR